VSIPRTFPLHRKVSSLRSRMGYRYFYTDILVRGAFSWPSNPSLCKAPESRDMFGRLHGTKVLVERWRREYNQIRPHSSLGYRPPAPEVVIPMGA